MTLLGPTYKTGGFHINQLTVGETRKFFRGKDAYCDCGTGRETVEHLVVWCPNPPKPKTWKASEIRSRRDLHMALQGGGRGKAALARAVVSWLLSSGRLPEYRLARKLEQEP